MNKQILKQLQNRGTFPSISIFMPTHRSFPENQQDKIRLKNLVNSAQRRLKEEAGESEIPGISKKLNDLAESIDYNNLLDGLAIFISKDDDYKFNFSFPVEERVIIDKTFATRDLVFGLNRSQPYIALIIDEKNTRFYSGIRETLSEVEHPDLPLKNFVHDIKSGEITDTSFNDRIHENEERLKNYLREADLVLNELTAQENIPYIIAGTQKQIALFKEISRSKSVTLGELTGNYGNSSGDELSKLIWPIAKNGFAEIRANVLDDVEKARGAKKFASGIDEVWKLAKEGRGLTLLTEINFSMIGTVTDEGFMPGNEAASTADVHTDDAVDEIIENVVSKGGKAVFFDNGKLDEYGKIALILRY